MPVLDLARLGVEAGRLAVCAVLAIGLLAPTARAQDADLPSPFGLTFPRDGDGPLSGLLRLRDAEADYRAVGERSPSWSQYTQIRAMAEANVGAHTAALAWFERTMGRGRDSVSTVPDDVRAVRAADYVASRARSAQVVMVNEAHHDASTRLLTLELLPILYEQGFRYFAAESFNAADVALNERGYPVDSSGVYSREPVFNAMIREAARLGYTLVPYEIEHGDAPDEDSLTYQQRRDYEQARNLADRTVGLDPSAKVLVHAGFAHIEEQATARWYPMAVYFRERTGIDPLTVSQTRTAERSTPAREHPMYRAADAAGLLRPYPVVLLHADDTPYEPSSQRVDIQVFGVRAGDIGGRPAWLASLPGRVRVAFEAPECPQTCEITVRYPDESTHAVPLDRVVTTGGPVSLYVPEDGVYIRMWDGRTGDRIPLPPWGAAPPAPRDR